MAALGSAVVMAVLLVALLALAACRPVASELPELPAEFGPPEAFDRLEGFAAVEDLNGLRPAQEYDYWEWQEWFDWSEPTVRAAGGRVPWAALDGAVQAALATRLAEHGFSPGCLPAMCSEYIVTVRGLQVMTLTTPAQVAAFLGEIDTPQDAYLLAYVNGFFPEQVRETTGGYEVLATEPEWIDSTERDCPGYRVDSYATLLRVSPVGSTEPVARKLDESYCLGIP